MDIQALKLELVQKILNTERPSLLSEIDKIFQKEEKNDWWEQLPVEIQDSIMEGMDDIQKGNTFSSDQVFQEAKSIF